MSPTRNFLDMENGMGCLSLDGPVNSERAQAETPSENRIDGEFIAVQWNGPEDPENPQNFTFARKCLISASLSLMTLCVTFASSVFSEVTVITAKEFDVGAEVMTLGTSLPIFGFAISPLVWGPASELFGRTRPLFVGYGTFILFQLPVALGKNVATILVGRFFLGFFGCAPLSIVGGTMVDIWDPTARGVAIAFFSIASFAGPTFGPILGGFIVDSYLGWRWTAWITMIGAAFFGAVSFVLVPETYSPVLLQRRAACLRRQTGNPAFRAPLDTHQPTWVDMITRYLFRPLKMLFLEPILDCLTIYISLIYGILYLFFESYPVAFTEVRGWTQLGVAALPFLAILVGVLCGGGLIIVVTKTRFVRQLERHGYVIPEERLPPMMIAAVLLPAGLFWFAWTSKPEVSWVAQTIAGVPIGCGILVVFMQGLNYLVDVYLPFANSAMAANTLVRCSFGGAFPLFATQMFHRLGVAWATSLLGFLTVAMIPIPTLLFVYGKRIRSLSRFSMAEERQ
ncbi:major facilitator superfamily domain-containing protein [Aspergillus pseudonomiae]|uniref:Major facilitator superfamily domain-containing protein n=1 Tax=Aspergillus pseudonomiae TaxID=1506151 RepID=A0A5N7CS60_9EURO|nr:major facilitator superfamily domain-containing protein [Aspergillus pseudonomiae]KAE8397070.1 major facilitator superfamily domain-containing protein [Aspergillus pseudonomiae]